MKQILYSPVGINQAMRVMFLCYLVLVVGLCVVTYFQTKSSEVNTLNTIKVSK